MIAVGGCLLTSSIQSEVLHPFVFWYGWKETLKITPPSFMNDHNTDEAQRYADEIQRPYIIPYAGAPGNFFLLKHGNTSPQTAQLVKSMLETETIHYMKLPAHSPNLNPFKYIWGTIE
ncbi:hypothetical protein TNCV_3798501 [Trichonephila clavipes]|nr:hypothetical protein TNCV_3798501 [Trichonephila clavipes]